MHLQFLVLLIDTCCANHWYTVSDLTIPWPGLYGHSIGIYDNQLHIVGGDTKQDTLSFSTSSYRRTLSNDTITNYTAVRLNTNTASSIPWHSTSNIIDPRYPTGFKCTGQCSTVYHQYLFIINPEAMFFDETGSLVIYNMDTMSFIAPSTFNHTLIYRESGICATNNATHIFAVGSKCHNCSMAHSDIEIFEIHTHGPWMIAGYMNIGRYWSGCNVHNGYLYVFGGYLNHDMNSNHGDVSDSIEKCALHPNEIMCYNLSDTQLYIPRAQHQIVMNKDAFMFIIGGMDSTAQMTEIVEIFDGQKDVMMNNEWFTYITNGRHGFAAFYDAKWDIVYITGGIDNTQAIHDTIDYYPVCELLANCHSNDITLQCGDHIHEWIDSAHDLYSFYFEITGMDDISSIQFNNCDSSMDTYVFLFVWNTTLAEWTQAGDYEWQWDDAGDCDGHKQESFAIHNPHYGYYHLVISGHEAGDYYAEFKCIYAVTNTTAPTLEPTYDPTAVRTTIPPTAPPTVEISTVDPTTFPTETPLDRIASTSDYDRISFILSFVCETERDLSIMNWKAWISNALLKALEADLRFIVDTRIDGVIHQLQNKQDAMQEIQKRRMQWSAQDAVYYFDVDCNITMDKLYLKDTDVCEASFSHAFEDGLGERLRQIQIYALAECDTDALVQTWNQMDGVKTTQRRWVDALPMIVLFAVLVMMLLIAVLVAKIQTFDNLQIKRLTLCVIYIMNAYCDIFIAVHICVTLCLFWEGMVAIVIVVIAWMKCVYDLNRFVAQWKCDTTHGKLLKPWLDPYHGWLYVLSFILGSTYAAMAMVNTNVFGMDVFSMGLSPDLHQILSTQRIWVVLLRNIPQIILQTVLILVRVSYVDVYSVLALCASIVSIVTYVYRSCIGFKYNNLTTKSMVFSWRISSVSIARDASCFGNKCEILRQYVSKALEINAEKERVDLLNVIQYFDTDIGGLTVYILITTAIDKNMEYFIKELQRLMQNSTLAKQIQILWKLPANEEVHCYRFKYNLSRSTSQMEMAIRLNVAKHIKVNTVGAGEDGSDSGSEDDGVGITTNSPNNRGIKHKQDFVVLNTNDEIEDDEDDENENLNTQQPVHEQYEYGFSLNSTTHEDLL